MYALKYRTIELKPREVIGINDNQRYKGQTLTPTFNYMLRVTISSQNDVRRLHVFSRENSDTSFKYTCDGHVYAILDAIVIRVL